MATKARVLARELKIKTTPDRRLSGTGRITIRGMHTMSWQEMGFATGKVSLRQLLEGGKKANIDIYDDPMDLEFIIEKIIIGGLAEHLGSGLHQAIEVNQAYVKEFIEGNMNLVSSVKHDPVKVRSLLKAIARNTATIVDISALKRDILLRDNIQISRPTIYDYLDTLNRLMIVEDQPAWNTHIRSSASLRKSPKRHFTDVCLAVAVLGLDKESLFSDLKFTGFLFESLVTHELRVYGQVNDAKVYHYRDSSGLEVDSIVQKYNGDWCAFEIKLGTGEIEKAAVSLLKFASNLDLSKARPPKSLNIITGTGISYTRQDGINVISLASLGA